MCVCVCVCVCVCKVQFSFALGSARLLIVRCARTFHFPLLKFKFDV